MRLSRPIMIPAILLIHFASPPLTSAQSVPGTINYQGRLTDNTPQQGPVTATVNMQFAIYDAPAGGTLLWQEPAGAATTPVPVTGGIFSVLLGGNGVAIPESLFNGGTQRWLELSANGEILTPRQVIAATGYANQAQYSASASSATVAITASNALALGGVAPAGYQLATAQSCGAGQFLNVIGNGTASCAAPPVNNLAPPVSLSAAAAGPVFSATNTGAGQAGSFAINNPSDGSQALSVTTNGTGSAGTFTITNPASAINAIFGSTTGGGSGLYGLSTAGNGVTGNASAAGRPGVYGVNTSGLSNASGVYGEASGSAGNGVWGFNATGPALYGQSGNGTAVTAYSGGGDLYSGGNGSGQKFRVDNGGNLTATSYTGGAVSAVVSGAGTAGSFYVQNTGGSGPTLASGNNATGPAASFYIYSNTNGSPVLNLSHTGAGDLIAAYNNSPGLRFRVDNAGSVSAAKFTGDGSGLTNLPGGAIAPPLTLSGAVSVPNNLLSATNTGSGTAGQFSIINPASAGDALVAITTGTGYALHTYATGSGAGAYLYANGNGSAAIIANDNTFATGPALLVGNTSAAPTIRAENNNGVGDIFQGWNGNITPVYRLDGMGRVTATKFTGDGSGLTNVPGSGVTPPLALSAASASPIVSAYNSGSGPGITGTANGNGNMGVYGYASGAAWYGVWGDTAGGTGVYGKSQSGTGVYAENSSGAYAALIAKNNGGGDLIQGTNGAATQFRVDSGGNVQHPGMAREGSEAGTGEPPAVAAGGPYQGLVMRRVNSTSAASGQVIARTDSLQLERDGSSGGLRLNVPLASPGQQSIVCAGINAAGTAVNVVQNVSAGATGIFGLYTSASNLVRVDCLFGYAQNNGHITQVVLLRRNTTDNSFVGTLSSTYNQ